MNEDDDIQAAEYVLGLTDAATSAATEARMRDDADFREGVQRWETRLAPIGETQSTAPPPPDLFERIERGLEDLDSAPASRTVRAEDGVWEEITPGVERKTVHVDPGAGKVSYLMRMRAGAALPRHRHSADEHCVLLEGRLRIGELSFGPGGFHYMPAGVTHGRLHAEEDSLFFIHGGG